MSVTTLSHADFDQECDGISMEDHCVFATLIAFSAALAAVAETDAFLKEKSIALGESFAEVSRRFDAGLFENDPAADHALQSAARSEQAESLMYPFEEYIHFKKTGPAPGRAHDAAQAAARLGGGYDLRKHASGAYHIAYQVTSDAQFRDACIADAHRFQEGAGVTELLCRPLFGDLTEPDRFLAEWTTLRQRLEASSVADWGVWIGWIQDRIDGAPLSLDQARKWRRIELDEFPRASALNAAFASA